MLTASVVPFPGSNSNSNTTYTYLVDDTQSTSTSVTDNSSSCLGQYDLEKVAAVASLSEYLAYIRLVHQGETGLTPPLLLQHLLILYNKYDYALVDYSPVEQALRHLVLSSTTPLDAVEELLHVYFDYIREGIDGPELAAHQFERFMQSLDSNNANIMSEASRAVDKTTATANIPREEILGVESRTFWTGVCTTIALTGVLLTFIR